MFPLIHITAFLTLIATLSPTIALACPSEMDKEYGIQLTRTEPFFSMLLQEADGGLTERRILFRDAQPEKVASLYLHPLIVGRREGKNGSTFLDYSAPFEDLNRLNEIGEWQSDVVFRAGTRLLASGTTIIKFLGNSSVKIGACRYKVWHIEDRLELEERTPIVFEKWYSPQLNVVLRIMRMRLDGQPMNEIAFDQITIGQGT